MDFPQDVWEYILGFIPKPKIEFNKEGFYIFNKKLVENKRGIIIHITKLTKCFMWYKAYTFVNINNLKENVFILNGEVKRKKKNELKYLDVLTNLILSLNHKQFINTHFPYFKAENSIYMKDINNHRIK
jgi:hypothetical protein